MLEKNYVTQELLNMEDNRGYNAIQIAQLKHPEVYQQIVDFFSK
jgi:hypothetical protein